MDGGEGGICSDLKLHSASTFPLQKDAASFQGECLPFSFVSQKVHDGIGNLGTLSVILQKPAVSKL